MVELFELVYRYSEFPSEWVGFLVTWPEDRDIWCLFYTREEIERNLNTTIPAAIYEMKEKNETPNAFRERLLRQIEQLVKEPIILIATTFDPLKR